MHALHARHLIVPPCGRSHSFAKFLVGADGEVIDRYGPQRSPMSIEEDVLEALKAVPPTDALVSPTGATVAAALAK